MKYGKRLRIFVRKCGEFRTSTCIYMKLQFVTKPIAAVEMCDYFATQGNNFLF